MRSAILGTLLGAALTAAAVGFSEPRGAARAEPPRAELGRAVPCRTDREAAAVAPLAAAASGLIAVTTPGDDKASLLTVIDAERHVMSVYGIDRETGRISLLSVRRFQWDLEMTEFNGDRPLPQEIRALMPAR